MAVVKSNTSPVYFTNASNSKHGVKREILSFSNVDATLVLLSMFTVFVDLSTDIIVVITYLLAGHTFWALSTIALAVIPALVVQAFSIRWHLLDGSSSRIHWITHCCLLGVFFRHVGVLRTGLEARRTGDVADFQLLFHQQSDICMLHLFESFMESAPQLVLQLYIMAQVHDWGPWTGVSAGASLVSLAWAIAAYTRAMRRARPEKGKATWTGLVLQAIWRAGLLAARVTALVLFAVCCQAWLFLLLGLHWLGMTVWVVLQKTDLCSTPWEECAYNCVVGVVYCFCFFNLREGRARGRMLAFYVVTVTQNLACLYLFLALAQHTHPVLATLGAGTIVGGTVIGLGAMLLYYRFFHPAGPIVLFGLPAIPNQGSAQIEDDVERHRTSQSRSADLPQTQTQLQVMAQAPAPMPSDTEKTNSLRSLKHLWSVDRDGSLSSRSDDIPGYGGSPQSDDGCTDKRMLLSSWASTTSTRRPIPAFPSSTSLHPDNAQVVDSVQQEKANHGNQTSSLQGLSNPCMRASQSPNTTNQLCSSNLTIRSTPSAQSSHSSRSSLTTRCVPSAQTSHTLQPAQADHVEVQSSQSQVDMDDSKLSWNCTSMLDDSQQSEINDSPPVDDSGGGNGLNKRRGICSSVQLGLDRIEEGGSASVSISLDSGVKRDDSDNSFARLCQKLVNEAEVKHLKSVSVGLVKMEVEKQLSDERVCRGKEEKRESDYIDSKQSAVSSDGTPSEVLSAHDYENICAVNIAREAWGLRSWRGYSDIETWLHDDSVVRDRRRDTLASIWTTATLTSASSERSTASESPPLIRHQWESLVTNNNYAPPLPCRRPKPAYNRMDDYIDTLAYDLAEIEKRELAARVLNETQDNVFVAQPYVVDQHGMLYPLPAPLDTILEEFEESSASTSAVIGADTGNTSTAPGWASSLVATIDEIRMGTSLCNTLDDTLAMTESDFDVGSCRSLQLDSSIAQHFPCYASPVDKSAAQLRFSHSLPSLLQAPRSWSQLTPEEVLFRSELKPRTTDFSVRKKHNPSSLTDQIIFGDTNIGSVGNRPHRKFPSLRNNLEMKHGISGEFNHPQQSSSGHSVGEASNVLGIDIAKRGVCQEEVVCGSMDKENALPVISTGVGEWHEYTQIQNECNAHKNPFKEADLPAAEWALPEEGMSYHGQSLLKKVLSPSTFVPRNKKLALASNASA